MVGNAALLPTLPGYLAVNKYSNSKFESVRHLALNLARALARNNTSSKRMLKSKRKHK
jgi:hypothetical protein